MVEFKAVISNPKDNKTYPIPVEGHHANSLLAKHIGDEVDGIFVGLPGYKLVITGGSDKDGIPMRNDIHGTKRQKVLVSKSVGFRPTHKGTRKRKTMRGDMISPDIVQINMKITAQGPKAISDLLNEGSESKDGKEAK